MPVAFFGINFLFHLSYSREAAKQQAPRQGSPAPNVTEEQFGASVQAPTDGTYVILRRKETTEPNYIEVDYVAQTTASATDEQMAGWCSEVTAKEEEQKTIIVTFVRDDGSSTFKNMGACVEGSLLRNGNGDLVTE
ncbi:MAG TPA: hypothetical protein VF681_16055 [Abditibacteriaceae bacterium]